ncbi:MAG: NADH:flavin oxidoreductase [Thermoplasmatota archaeon]
MPSLLDPIKIGNIILKNRIVMPPMARNLSTIDGEPKSKLIDHYAKRADHLGLVIVEHSYVSVDGKLSERQLGIDKDDLIPSLKKLSDAIKKRGASACIQITHAGGKAQKDIIGMKPKAPSKDFFEKDIEELTINEMKEIKKDFGEAALRAEKAGFDAVEIHGAHGFLLSEFVSPLSNKRKDKYGGSLDNRLRYPFEIVQEVKKSIKDIPLFYRLGATDMLEGGFNIEEAKYMAKRLEKHGVDVVDVSGGLCGSVPPEFEGKQGYFVSIAEQIKKEIDVPVIGVGGIKDHKYADRVIREDKIDMVAVGRALLKNPNWAKEAKDKLK